MMGSIWTKALDVALIAGAVAMMGAVMLRGLPSAGPTDGATGFEGWREDLMFDRLIGPEEAPYRLVVWMDYQCPACRRFETELDQTRAELGDSLAVVYRYYPLASHPLAFPAAIAAECARAQDRFPEMHEALFEDPLSGDSLPLTALMENSGIPDTASFRTCLSDSTSVARKAVIMDRLRIKSLNVRGTPALQIGDRIATGGLQSAELIERLRDGASAPR